MSKVNECPQCGAINKADAAKCEYCGSAFVFEKLVDFRTAPELELSKALSLFRKKSNDSDIDAEEKLAIKTSLGLCYLKQKAYPLATAHFGKMLDDYPESANLYIYRALSLIAGKKPRLLNMSTIKEINGLLNMSHMMGGEGGQALALLAVIEYDYCAVNGIKFQKPSPFELMNQAREEGISFDELLASLEIVGLSEKDVQELI